MFHSDLKKTLLKEFGFASEFKQLGLKLTLLMRSNSSNYNNFYGVNMK